jgi:hypothetical protein
MHLSLFKKFFAHVAFHLSVSYDVAVPYYSTDGCIPNSDDFAPTPDLTCDLVIVQNRTTPARLQVKYTGGVYQRHVTHMHIERCRLILSQCPLIHILQEAGIS